MGETLTVGELHGGGLVLGYRCPSRCRHCLYGSGPHRRDGEPADLAELDRVLDLLAERAPRARMHIGGGEPFLDLDRLVHAVTGLAERGLALDYVETNAVWLKGRRQGEEVLRRLADAGLGCVLISVSPFHAEFIPPSRTLLLVELADRLLSRGSFVWVADFLPELAAVAPGHRLDLQARLADRSAGYARDIAQRYHLVAAARAGRFLAHQGAARPWRLLLSGADCARRLADTSHFHVDGCGGYVPGLCAGLVLPLQEVPGRIDLAKYPVLAALVRGGVGALVELAREHGFTPAERYSSPCDLCTHARKSLFPLGFAELGPDGFYDERSVPGF